jgi:hypothetical protein
VGLGLVFGPIGLAGPACPPAFVRALARAAPTAIRSRTPCGRRRAAPLATRPWVAPAAPRARQNAAAHLLPRLPSIRSPRPSRLAKAQQRPRSPSPPPRSSPTGAPHHDSAREELRPHLARPRKATASLIVRCRGRRRRVHRRAVPPHPPWPPAYLHPALLNPFSTLLCSRCLGEPVGVARSAANLVAGDFRPRGARCQLLKRRPGCIGWVRLAFLQPDFEKDF